MPSFKVQVANIHKVGPVTEILISQSFQYLKATGNQQKFVKLLAMIDTGASGTVIREGIAEELGIKPIGEVFMNTPSSVNHRCFQYDIQMLFPNNIGISSCIVSEAPLKNQHIQCLIGRDILQQSIFIYSGLDNSFTICF